MINKVNITIITLGIFGLVFLVSGSFLLCSAWGSRQEVFLISNPRESEKNLKEGLSGVISPELLPASYSYDFLVKTMLFQSSVNRAEINEMIIVPFILFVCFFLGGFLILIGLSIICLSFLFFYIVRNLKDITKKF
jgi:hypothetical protein